MPLSEYEQKILDQIELDLSSVDQGLHRTFGPTKTGSRSPHRRWGTIATVGVTGGLALVLGGLVGNILMLAIVGFLLIVATLTYAVKLRAAAAPVRHASKASQLRSPPREEVDRPRSKRPEQGQGDLNP